MRAAWESGFVLIAALGVAVLVEVLCWSARVGRKKQR